MRIFLFIHWTNFARCVQTMRRASRKKEHIQEWTWSDSKTRQSTEWKKLKWTTRKNSRDSFQLMGSGFLMKLWSDDKDVTGAFRSHRSTFYDVCSVLLKQQDIKSSCLTFGFKLKDSILNNDDTHTHQVQAQLPPQRPFSAGCVRG